MSNDYKYILQPYDTMKSRHVCPECGKRGVFSKYIDKETGEEIADHVGRCNREVGCGYHYRPKQYFEDNNFNGPKPNGNYTPKRTFTKPTIQKAEPTKNVMKVSGIPINIFKQSLSHYEKNNFTQYLKKIFGSHVTNRLIEKFYIGSTKNGSTVFWLIDQENNIASGQVITYDSQGHTVKYTDAEGNTKRKNSWVHTYLKNGYQSLSKPLPEWLQSFIDDNPKFPCLFGLPQLSVEDKDKPIGLVEAAKTAVIASVYYPGLIWMSIGSLSYLNADRLNSIADREIILYPDLGCYDHWKLKADQLKDNYKIAVSEYLETKIGERGIKKGDDLADCLFHLKSGSSSILVKEYFKI